MDDLKHQGAAAAVAGCGCLVASSVPGAMAGIGIYGLSRSLSVAPAMSAVIGVIAGIVYSGFMAVLLGATLLDAA